VSDYRYERGPIQWDPIDAPAPDDHGAVFEDLLARAALDSPDIAAAIDRTQHAATPADASDTDTATIGTWWTARSRCARPSMRKVMCA
jgi:hypothetical protein